MIAESAVNNTFENRLGELSTSPRSSMYGCSAQAAEHLLAAFSCEITVVEGVK
jgi:hypothetical protein